jgi:DNA-binding CsgD family transcriptional regulator/sugar-specific transcriptional regulator TrmB
VPDQPGPHQPGPHQPGEPGPRQPDGPGPRQPDGPGPHQLDGPGLRQLGLSAGEAATYLALLRLPGCAPDELALVTGLGAGATALVLMALEAAGLAERDASGDGRFHPMPPDLAFETVLLDRARQLHEARVLVHSLTAQYSHAAAGRGRDGRVVEVISDHQAALTSWREAHASAQEQVRAAEVPPYLEAQTEPNPIEVELLSRGVTHRVLYDTSVAGLAGRFDELKDGIHRGEQARVLTGVPLRALIVDDRLALLPARSGRMLSDGLLLVRPSNLLHALSSLFELLWERAVPLRFSDIGQREAEGNDEDLDRLILKLLAIGLTDRAVARQLNLSQRTVQRHVATLMTRLGARTRLQAGVQGIRQGWL